MQEDINCAFHAQPHAPAARLCLKLSVSMVTAEGKSVNVTEWNPGGDTHMYAHFVLQPFTVQKKKGKVCVMKAAVTSGWTPGKPAERESDRVQAGDEDEKNMPETIPKEKSQWEKKKNTPKKELSIQTKRQQNRSASAAKKHNTGISKSSISSFHFLLIQSVSQTRDTIWGVSLGHSVDRKSVV